MKAIKLFFDYIKYRLKTLVCLLIFGIIFTVVFVLFNAPYEAVLYSCLLCTFVGVILAALDFIFFLRKHRELHRLLASVALSLDGLVHPDNLIEWDYQALLQTVNDEKVERISRADAEMSEMLEYYTLWAHQIKTPIFAMRLLLDEKSPSDSGELSMELFRIEQYVEMVLGYLRLGGESDYIIKKYQLDAIIKSSVKKYARVFIGKKLSLVYDGCDASVVTDEKWLGFAIEQLLSNSLKYTDRGTITISFRDNRLTISDTGIGIAPEDIPRVFDNGYTGYNGRSDKKSTGIGLYLCKKILNRLGHTIELTSVVGEGTSVTIGFGEEQDRSG